MIKKIIIILILLMIPLTTKAEEQVNIHLFYSETCPHCHNEIEFLNELIEEDEPIKVMMYEVGDMTNAALTKKVKEAFNVKASGVPFTVIGTKTFMGYSDDIGHQIKETIEFYKENEQRDVTTEIIEKTFDSRINPIIEDEIERGNFSLPILGEINAKKVSIPLIAITLGVVDGFNPCAMWVLLFLIGMTMSMKDKKKLWLIGTTFLLTSAAVYMLIMFSLLQIVVELSTISYVKIAIGIFAIAAGIYSLNKYRLSRKEDKGCKIVDEKKRNKIINRTKKIITEKNTILVILGVIVLAVSVNVVELACSAGLPFVFTQILALNNITGVSSIMYILLYTLFFLIDDLIIFAIAVKSFEKIGMNTKYSNIVSLIGGIIMLIIGVSMIFFPQLLTF